MFRRANLLNQVGDIVSCLRRSPSRPGAAGRSAAYSGVRLPATGLGVDPLIDAWTEVACAFPFVIVREVVKFIGVFEVFDDRAGELGVPLGGFRLAVLVELHGALEPVGRGGLVARLRESVGVGVGQAGRPGTRLLIPQLRQSLERDDRRIVLPEIAPSPGLHDGEFDATNTIKSLGLTGTHEIQRPFRAFETSLAVGHDRQELVRSGHPPRGAQVAERLGVLPRAVGGQAHGLANDSDARGETAGDLRVLVGEGGVLLAERALGRHEVAGDQAREIVGEGAQLVSDLLLQLLGSDVGCQLRQRGALLPGSSLRVAFERTASVAAEPRASAGGVGMGASVIPGTRAVPASRPGRPVVPAGRTPLTPPVVTAAPVVTALTALTALTAERPRTRTPTVITLEGTGPAIVTATRPRPLIAPLAHRTARVGTAPVVTAFTAERPRTGTPAVIAFERTRPAITAIVALERAGVTTATIIALEWTGITGITVERPPAPVTTVSPVERAGAAISTVVGTAPTIVPVDGTAPTIVAIAPAGRTRRTPLAPVAVPGVRASALLPLATRPVRPSAAGGAAIVTAERTAAATVIATERTTTIAVAPVERGPAPGAATVIAVERTATAATVIPVEGTPAARTIVPAITIAGVTAEGTLAGGRSVALIGRTALAVATVVTLVRTRGLAASIITAEASRPRPATIITLEGTASSIITRAVRGRTSTARASFTPIRRPTVLPTGAVTARSVGATMVSGRTLSIAATVGAISAGPASGAVARAVRPVVPGITGIRPATARATAVIPTERAVTAVVSLEGASATRITVARSIWAGRTALTPLSVPWTVAGTSFFATGSRTSAAGWTTALVSRIAVASETARAVSTVFGTA